MSDQTTLDREFFLEIVARQCLASKQDRTDRRFTPIPLLFNRRTIDTVFLLTAINGRAHFSRGLVNVVTLRSRRAEPLQDSIFNNFFRGFDDFEPRFFTRSTLIHLRRMQRRY